MRVLHKRRATSAVTFHPSLGSTSLPVPGVSPEISPTAGASCSELRDLEEGYHRVYQHTSIPRKMLSRSRQLTTSGARGRLSLSLSLVVGSGFAFASVCHVAFLEHNLGRHMAPVEPDFDTRGLGCPAVLLPGTRLARPCLFSLVALIMRLRGGRLPWVTEWHLRSIGRHCRASSGVTFSVRPLVDETRP